MQPLETTETVHTGRAVLRFELHQLIRDRALSGLGLLLFALTVLALFAGWRWFAFQQDAVERIQLQEQQVWQAKSEQARAILAGEQKPPRGWWANPADVRGFAYYLMQNYASKPPLPLTSLVVGQSDLLPYYLRIGPGMKSKWLQAYEAEHPRRLLLGRFDAAFVALFIFPLLLLAATYSALAGERESGRLLFLGVHGVSPLQLVMLRVGLRALMLATVFLFTVLIGVVLLSLPLGIYELLAWLGLCVSYFLFWTALVMVVIAMTTRAATAALWLAAAWLLLLVILPGFINLGANLLYPLPSRAEFTLTQRQAADTAEQDRSGLLGRYLRSHPELSSVDNDNATIFRFAANIAADDYVAQQLATVQQHFDAQLLSQQQLINRWQWLSPAIAAQLSMTELAGAGHTRQRHFLEQISEHTDALRAFFYPRLMRGEYRFDAFDEVPRWDWQPLDAEKRRAGLLMCLLVLLSMSGIGLAIAIRRLKHTASV